MTSFIDPTIVRLLRLARFSRYARMLKTASLLDVLRLILKTTRGSLGTVFWSLFLVAGIQTITGMVIWQFVITYVTDANEPIETRRQVHTYWGTFSKVMITMFEVSFNNPQRFTMLLSENVNEGYGWFFMAYRIVVNFVLLNVIRAVFIKQTFKVAENDPELSFAESVRQHRLQMRALQGIFAEFDTTGDGFVSQTEFSNMLSHSWVRQWLENHGLKITGEEDAASIWRFLDVDASDQLSPEEFLRGLPKISGTAKSLEQMMIDQQVQSIHRICNCMEQQLAIAMETRVASLSALSSELQRADTWPLEPHRADTRQEERTMLQPGQYHEI